MAQQTPDNSSFYYEAFFTLNLDLLCIASTEGHFLKINASWESILGYTIEDLLNVKMLDLIHPDDQEKTLEALQTLDSGVTLLSFSNRYKHKDGHYKHLEWRSRPVGSLIYASAKDITDLKQREEEFQRNEKRLNAMVESQSNYIIRLDTNFNYTQANKKFSQDFAWLYGTENLVGLNCFESINEKHLGDLDQWAKLSLAQPGFTFQKEIVHKGINNTELHILWEYTCISGEQEGAIEFQGWGINITSKKELEAKQRLEKERQVIEMSTPITQLWDGILLLPIVGVVSAKRAGSIMQAILKKITDTQAKIVILDISGVAIVDSEVANHFIKLSKATRLMGCHCTICGISPAISQTMVELGITMEEINTTGTMRDALEQGLKASNLKLISI